MNAALLISDFMVLNTYFLSIWTSTLVPLEIVSKTGDNCYILTSGSSVVNSKNINQIESSDKFIFSAWVLANNVDESLQIRVNLQIPTSNDVIIMG